MPFNTFRNPPTPDTLAKLFDTSIAGTEGTAADPYTLVSADDPERLLGILDLTDIAGDGKSGYLQHPEPEAQDPAQYMSIRNVLHGFVPTGTKFRLLPGQDAPPGTPAGDREYTIEGFTDRGFTTVDENGARFYALTDPTERLTNEINRTIREGVTIHINPPLTGYGGTDRLIQPLFSGGVGGSLAVSTGSARTIWVVATDFSFATEQVPADASAELEGVERRGTWLTRWRPDISAGQVLEVNGVQYTLTSVDEEGGRMSWLRLVGEREDARVVS